MVNPDSLKGKKVLLVEDDKFLSKFLGKKLVDAGADFTHVENGKDALESVDAKKPDVMILDLMLPEGIDGFEVLKRVKEKEESKDVPVVILSNLSSAGEIAHGMKLGAFRFLVKASVDPDEILEHVESALTSVLK
jgi:DNA-binding response OmpR family regulator